MPVDGCPQDPVPERDEPDQPLRGPTWAARELRSHERDDDRPPRTDRRIADEDRRRTPEPSEIEDHAP